MPETPNHSYNVPDRGAQDWHVPLNENFRQYDVDIELRGPQSELTSNQPEDGAKFLAVDTGVVFVGDGSEWQPTLVMPRYVSADFIGNAGSVVLGSVANDASADGAVVGGGGAAGGPGSTSEPNEVTGAFGVVAGGLGNRVTVEDGVIGGGELNRVLGEYATVAGGSSNRAGEIGATVGGGANNEASGEGSTVGGGVSNEASGEGSTVGGGAANAATDSFAAVPGGSQNEASGNYSLAAGRQANTAGNAGAFVWGDSSNQQVNAGSRDEFKVQASGGAVFYSNSGLSTGVLLGAGEGTWSSLSARAVKTGVDPVDPQAVLDGVRDLEVDRWEYDSDSDAVHMGPMAEAFHDAFGLGGDDRRIATVDADGVALAAVQGLAERLDDAHGRITEQQQRVNEQADRIDDLEAENEALRERLAAVERRLDADGEGDEGPADAPEIGPAR
jgi:hypothetical protein